MCNSICTYSHLFLVLWPLSDATSYSSDGPAGVQRWKKCEREKGEKTFTFVVSLAPWAVSSLINTRIRNVAQVRWKVRVKSGMENKMDSFDSDAAVDWRMFHSNFLLNFFYFFLLCYCKGKFEIAAQREIGWIDVHIWKWSWERKKRSNSHTLTRVTELGRLAD